MRETSWLVDKRLNGINDGPWASRGELALSWLEAASVKDISLSKTLQPHWLRKTDFSQLETARRDSLDFALSQLELYELAVETAYLTVDQVAPCATPLANRLLRFEEVWKYVDAYDYLMVRYLAGRLITLGHGIEPSVVRCARTLPPPPIDSKGEIRFATFLDHHRRWESDALVEEWLGFLDGYVESGDEKERFYAFLMSRSKRSSRRFERLWMGAQRSVSMLASLFDLLGPEERARFGLTYAYWLAKFNAYELSANGYVHDDENWGELDEGWLDAVEARRAYERDLAETELENKTGKDNWLKGVANVEYVNLPDSGNESEIQVVRNTWQLVRRFVEHTIHVELPIVDPAILEDLVF